MPVIVRPDFDEATHTYSAKEDGRVFPGTTEILKDLKLTPPYKDDGGEKLAFGKATHKGCDLMCRGRLDKARTNTALLPYIDGFEEKHREMKIEPIFSELLVWHGTLWYAGTLDLLCWIYDRSSLALFDMKTGVPPQCVELQTASYVEALRWMVLNGALIGITLQDLKTIRRFSCQLTPGRAIVRECKDSFDYAAWNGAVNLYKWMKDRR